MPRDTNTKLGIKSLPDKNKKYDANNVSIGYKSLNSNKKGFQNTAVGSESMRLNTESHNNTAVGFKSLEKSVGFYNTALGALTGKTLVDGKSNVIIGKEANVSKKDAKNQVIIGANAKGLEDNSVTLGNNEVNNVFMSDTKNASLHCGSLNIYNSKGRKSYSFPDVGANKNNILETDGKGNLRWVDRITKLNGLSDVIQSNRTVEVVTKQKNYVPTSWSLVGTVTGLAASGDITQSFIIHTPGSGAQIKITLNNWKYSSHTIESAGNNYQDLVTYYMKNRAEK